jgi:hypothetical protein
LRHANQLAAFGCEDVWWRLLGIEPIPIALSLWQGCVAEHDHAGLLKGQRDPEEGPET